MSSKFASDGIGSTDRQTDWTKWSTRLSRALLIPCIALTAATLQQSHVKAQSRFERRILERIQKRRLEEESKLTDTQKQQLFEARRDWALSSYDQRFAQLKSGQNCLESAKTLMLARLAGKNSNRLSSSSLNRVVRL